MFAPTSKPHSILIQGITNGDGDGNGSEGEGAKRDAERQMVAGSLAHREGAKSTRSAVGRKVRLLSEIATGCLHAGEIGEIIDEGGDSDSEEEEWCLVKGSDAKENYWYTKAELEWVRSSIKVFICSELI